MNSFVLGGGCFWCLDSTYMQFKGVDDVEVGYMGGASSNPSYEQVCDGNTGHVEVVRVSFEPAVIGLREVLEIFFAIHDPTTLNRQGNDVGPQYRSGIYLHDESQRAVAQAVWDEAQSAHAGRLVTELELLSNYWRADDYHQHYFAQHPHQGYCAFVVAPKVEKFRKTFRTHLRP